MSHRTLPSARRLAVALVAMLLAGSLAVPAVAGTIDGNRFYRASVTPSLCVVPDESASFTVTLTNTSRNAVLGSADITFGATWSALPSHPDEVAVSVGGATAGSVAIVGNRIEVRGLSVAAAGGTVDVTFFATPSGDQNAITTQAKQANEFNGRPGNDLTRVDADPVVTATGGCELTFLTQPADAETGMPVPGRDGPAPEVAVVDAEGELVALDGAAIDVALVPAVDGNGVFADSSTTGVATTGGVATFGELRVTAPGRGYRLAASSTGFDSVVSDRFEVGDDVAICAPGEVCTTNLGLGGLSVVATGTAGADGGRLYLSAYGYGADDCSTPAGVSRLPEAISVGGVGLAGKRIAFTIDEATRKLSTDNGVASYQVCAEPVGSIDHGETLPFFDRYTGQKVVGADNDPAGNQLERGWLPDCRSGASPVGAPCVVGRTGTRDGGVTITVDFGSRFRMG